MDASVATFSPIAEAIVASMFLRVDVADRHRGGDIVQWSESGVTKEFANDWRAYPAGAECCEVVPKVMQPDSAQTQRAATRPTTDI